jgi:Tol biopolymer transport system component
MELVEGKTLRDRLGDRPLPTDETLRIAAQIAQGLAKAHAAGIVHRDLKPGNVMITDEGLVKILDFGLAKLTAPSDDAVSELTTAPEVTRAGVVLGTVPYMSPEQAAGRPVDFRSDQFSFGSILYEMATGRRAFEADTTPQTLAAILEAEPTPVVELNNRVPAALVGLIERCLARDPGGRYDSTGDVVKELARCSAVASDYARPRQRWLAVAGLVALAALVAGVLYRQSSRPEAQEPSTPLVSVPLTSYPGREAEPTFSPDGSQVAFSWDGERQDNQDIYVKVIGSEQPLRLTTHPAQDGSPSWSPDGRRIAFLRDQPEGGSEVLLVPPTGGPERRLAEVGASSESGLGWSPDGRRLVVADQSTPAGPLGLSVLDAETGTKEQLIPPPPGPGYGYVHPTFSPDGRTVAFKGWHGQLSLVAASGGEPRGIALAHWLGRVAWVPSGKEIIFDATSSAPGEEPPRPTEGYSSPSALWRVSARGGAARQLPGPSGVNGVAVSRQGNRLVFAQSANQDDIWRVDLRPPAPTAEAQTRLIASTRTDANPQFSPDDERVAFTSARTGHFEIWVADKNGGNLLQLTSIGVTGAAGSPRWSPDGKAIAFDFRKHGEGRNFDIYVISVAGGAPRQVTTAPSTDYTPSWSSDGRWIYFSSNRSGEWQVWKVPSDGEEEGNAQQLTRGGGFAPIGSTNGKDVYFARRRTGAADRENAIFKVPVEGGDEEAVIETLTSSYCNWDVTAEGVYYVDQDPYSPEAPWVVKLFTFDQRRVAKIARLAHRPRLGGPAFSVSSDGRWALSMQTRHESDLMLVENFR